MPIRYEHQKWKHFVVFHSTFNKVVYGKRESQVSRTANENHTTQRKTFEVSINMTNSFKNSNVLC